MGLIRAFHGAVSSALADQWKEYIYCDSLNTEVLAAKGHKKTDFYGSDKKKNSNVISDGSKIVVSDGQAMLIVENGRIVDISTEPGGFIFESGTEPSVFCGGSQSIRSAFDTMTERSGYGGQAVNEQRVYYVDLKEVMGNKVGVGEVPFRDSEFGFTIRLKGYGTYSYRIADPITFYRNVCANVQETFLRLAINDQLRTEMQQAMQPALERIAQQGIPYDRITLYTSAVVESLDQELEEQWLQARGIQLLSIAITSLRPEEESAKKIAQFQESRVYTNAGMTGARLGTAQGL